MADTKFSTSEFLDGLGQELVSEFGRSSRVTTPGMKGSAREKTIRNKLQKCLSSVVSVGSGFIIDIDGKVSKQQDIVIYESAFCPVFNFSDSEEVNYYPCENVCCAGEIKSDFTADQLRNVFDKCESVKTLTRQSKADKGPLDLEETCLFRTFGTSLSISGTKDEEFSQKNKYTDQIFYFAVAETMSASRDFLLQTMCDRLMHSPIWAQINLIVTLDGEFICFANKENNSILDSAHNADAIFISNKTGGSFRKMIHNIRKFIHKSRTTPIEYTENYYHGFGREKLKFEGTTYPLIIE